MKKTKQRSSLPATKVSVWDATNEDFKNAVLIVSLLLNVAVLTTYLVARVSSTYSAQLSSLLR